MPSVSVSSDELRRQLTMLAAAAEEVERAYKTILSQYRQLGGRWNDNKFRELGDVINESVSSLKKIQLVFLKGQKDMIQILRAVEEYEQTNLNGAAQGSFGNAAQGAGTQADFGGAAQDQAEEGGFTLHYSREMTDNMWQRNVESTDAMIDNYKEALMERGVPDGEWLNNTLARHRAAMLEQCGYELDVASGHSQDSTNDANAYSWPGDYHAFYDQLAEEYRQYCQNGGQDK